VRSTRGFTLLEMIVASTIMAVAVVGLLAAISGAERNAARLREYDRAVGLAKLRMNELLLDNFTPRDLPISGGFDPSLTGGIEAGWRARVTAFELPPVPAPGQFALDRIALEVWWKSGTHERTMALEGYRRRLLTAADIVPGVPR
jgi:general secretion pathway protein I